MLSQRDGEPLRSFVIDFDLRLYFLYRDRRFRSGIRDRIQQTKKNVFEIGMLGLSRA